MSQSPRRLVRQRWLLVAILGLLGALYYWQRPDSSEDRVSRDPSRRVLRASRVLPPHQPPDNTGATGEVASWYFEAGISGRRIAGVVWSDDAPVVGATVELGSDYAHLSGSPRPTVISDETGAFDFGVRPPTEYMVVATKDGMSGDGTRVNLRDPTTQTESLRIELPPCTNWFIGQAHNVYGDVVSDGKVEVMAWIGRSWLDPMYTAHLENDGSFSICAPRNERWVLWISAPGYGKQWLRTPMPVGGWQVQLYPESVVEGTIEDTTGQPIANARVVLTLESFGGAISAPIAQKTISHADGSFRIDGVMPGQYLLMADHGNYRLSDESPTVSLALGESVSNLRYVMSECRAISGVVLAGESPVSGARVRNIAFTQNDGSFVLPCIEFSSFDIDIAGYRIESGKRVESGTTALDDLVIQVSELANVSGTLTRDGLPVPDTTVYIGHQFTIAFSPLPSYSAKIRSDSRGNFRFRGVPPGTHSIGATSPGYSSPAQTIDVNRDDLDSVNVSLVALGLLKGHVRSADGQGVPNVLLRFVMPGESPDTAFMTTSSEDGSFSVQGVDFGEYQVCLGNCLTGPDPRFLPLHSERWPLVDVTTDATELLFTIRNPTLLSITGQVNYTDGQPAAFVSIRQRNRLSGTTTDSTGAFVLPGLVLGDYYLSVRTLTGQVSEDQLVRSGSHVEFILDIPGTVSGRIVGGEGTCSIEMSSKKNPQRSESKIREFYWPSIVPGKLVLTARCGDKAVSQEVILTVGQNLELDLNVVATASLRGRVHDSQGNPRAGIRCFADGKSQVTDDDGDFKLRNLAPGLVRVSCTSELVPNLQRLWHGKHQVELAPGEEASINVEVRSSPTF